MALPGQLTSFQSPSGIGLLGCEKYMGFGAPTWAKSRPIFLDFFVKEHISSLFCNPLEFSFGMSRHFKVVSYTNGKFDLKKKIKEKMF